jgi:hypothetical protein
MNVYSDFTIPAFGRHVTIHFYGNVQRIAEIGSTLMRLVAGFLRVL